MRKFDPSRTTLLRRKMEREIKRRLALLKRAVVAYVLSGTEPAEPVAPVSNTIRKVGKKRWRLVSGAGKNLGTFGSRGGAEKREAQVLYFKARDEGHTANAAFDFKAGGDAKLRGFNRWFAQQAEKKLLTTDAKGKPWTGDFVQSAYKKGLVRGYLDARRRPLATASEDFVAGSKAEFLASSFAAPERMSKVRALGTRALEELRGVSGEMATKMNRALANGMIRGDSPRAIAKVMADEVDGLSRKRALVIARTEIIHAHAEGQLDAFEDLGVPGASGDVELSTAGDDRVCEECADLDGQVFTLDAARGKLPIHPNCRCAWIPVADAELTRIAEATRRS